MMQERAMSSSDRETLRRLEESNTPSFRKMLTSTMLQRNERLGIPSRFLDEHGDRLQKILSFVGSNGKSRSVALVERGADTRARVYLSSGWTSFAKENGFQMGDEVIFWLVASSKFRVFRYNPSVVLGKTKGDEDHGMSDDAVTSGFTPRHVEESNSASTANHEDIQVPIPPCPVYSNPVEARVLTRSVKVVPFHQRQRSIVRREEYVKYPGLGSAIAANSRFPQFVKRLTPNSHSAQLDVPFAFVKEHGDKLQERVVLVGASGHLRVVHIRITTFSGHSRVRLGRGWKEFSLENGFSDGDVLLFSLVGVSTFEVKTFLEATGSVKTSQQAVFP